jgi:hypothetical protein
MGALLLALAVGLFAQDGLPKDPPSRALLLELTAEPRLAGTSGDLQGAKVAARQLALAGWEVELDEREVVLSYPKRISVEIWATASETTPVSQRVERFDADAIPPGDVPLYNAWSASGNVRAKVVDVGFGLRADYEELAQAGIDVRGAIALARYGRAYRGVKVELAQEHGCVGVLLFSDPAGDGGQKGEVWPEGPWKPDHEGQRGSVLPIANAPGDPSTPGLASPRPGEESKRLSLEELAQRLPRIPCTPIGAKEAGEILQRLQARGPGPVEVALELDVPRQLRTIRNVIATLPAQAADAPVAIAGGHRDAWVRGANDNGSGCVALIRAAQHLGQRVRDGWRPGRTLKIALWDAEEFGLIGSTEWGRGARGVAARALHRVRELRRVDRGHTLRRRWFAGHAAHVALGRGEAVGAGCVDDALAGLGQPLERRAARTRPSGRGLRPRGVCAPPRHSGRRAGLRAATPVASTTPISMTSEWSSGTSIRVLSGTSSRGSFSRNCSRNLRHRT